VVSLPVFAVRELPHVRRECLSWPANFFNVVGEKFRFVEHEELHFQLPPDLLLEREFHSARGIRFLIKVRL